MQKLKTTIVVLLVIMLVACAGGMTKITPQRTYYEAQEFYLNAWSSYHNVWLAMPDTDPQKKEWTREYHPKFLEAAKLLSIWGKVPSGNTPDKLTTMLDTLESILIKLAIKGGK